MHRLKRLAPILLMALLLLSACRRAPASRDPASAGQPSPTTTPAPTPRATRAPIATSPPPSTTPLPSPTPVSTATPPPAPPRITFLFTGNIVPARCVQAKIDAISNPDYPYEELRELISAADLAVGTLNATISDFTHMTGCVDTFLLVGRSTNAAALARAGFDAMSVATNHIKNCGVVRCGERAFLDTLDNLQQAGIRPIGAGRSLEEALQPQVFEIKGIRFVFVSLGEIEPSAFAAPGTPGIAPLDDANLRAAIVAARELGDVVIVLPHWGPEYSTTPNYRQLHFAQVAVEAGADLVVGNHTHTVQALQTFAGVPVFYGLGNFMFDQAWSLPTQQGVALLVTFEGQRYVGYEFVPVHIDGDGRIHLAGPQEAQEILAAIEEASQKLPPMPEN